jgi:hypothetical protein
VADCECGCGREVQAGRRFVHGHNRRGVSLSPETRAKVTGRPQSDDAGAGAIHHWLKKHYPKAGRCESCGREGRTDYAFSRHPEPHTRERDDYRELCRSCHFKADESLLNRGRSLNAPLTNEQRREAGRRGAAARWGY